MSNPSPLICFTDPCSHWKDLWYQWWVFNPYILQFVRKLVGVFLFLFFLFISGELKVMYSFGPGKRFFLHFCLLTLSENIWMLHDVFTFWSLDIMSMNKNKKTLSRDNRCAIMREWGYLFNGKKQTLKDYKIQCLQLYLMSHLIGKINFIISLNSILCPMKQGYHIIF